MMGSGSPGRSRRITMVDSRVRAAEAYVQARNTDAARIELQTVLTREPSNANAKQLLEKIETH